MGMIFPWWRCCAAKKRQAKIVRLDHVSVAPLANEVCKVVHTYVLESLFSTIGFTWCFVICVVATINITSCTKNFSATGDSLSVVFNPCSCRTVYWWSGFSDFYFFHDCHETLTGWKYFTEKVGFFTLLSSLSSYSSMRVVSLLPTFLNP